MSLPLADLVSQGMLSRVEEQLAAAGNNLQRVSIIEQFLLSRLMPLPRDLRIHEAVQKIKLAQGNLQISKLPKELYMSQDSFEKKFRRIIGTSPKQYARIIRFRNLIFSHSASNRLTDLAHTSGYFDQAHFIKDFRTFTGQAPGDFFKNSRFW
jgi:methylphosphotriester-DNA--protein-cysteine methyltransferase